MPEEADPHAARFEEINRRSSEMDRAFAGRVDHVERMIGDHASHTRGELRDIEMRLAHAVTRIEKLESSMWMLESELRKLSVPRPDVAAEAESPRFSAPAISAAPSAVAAPVAFPVRVYDIAGVTVMTGTHPSVREVETDETYRDEFGQRKKRRIMEPVEVPEFGYQARFSMQNMTDQPIECTAVAGRAPQTFSLPPQGVIEEATLDWTPGSALTVTADGQRTRHPIPWE